MTEKALRFVLRSEMAWVGLLALGMNRQARAWSNVLDAMIDDNPQLAIRLAEEQNFESQEILSIREAFDLT